MGKSNNMAMGESRWNNTCHEESWLEQNVDARTIA